MEPVERVLHTPHRVLQPSMATFEGAVMVTDITGFTKLTEILSKQEGGGVELLTKCMNTYFGDVRYPLFLLCFVSSHQASR